MAPVGLLPVAEALKPEKSEQQLQCEANGGKWDAVNKVCILPEKEPVVEPTQEQQFTPEDKSQFGTLSDAETGRITGFTQGGRTFLGLSPEEAKAAVEAEAGKQSLEVGGQAEAVLTRRQQEIQSQGLDLSAQVGQDPLQELQNTFSAQEVDYLAALASGVPGIIPDLIGGGLAGGGAVFGLGAAATAATGGAAAPVAGGTIAAAAIITGVGNAVRGFYSDFVSDVTRQKGELIETPIRTLTETKTILNDITGAQNANPADAANNLEAFNQNLQLLDDEYDRLKDLTDDDLNAFLGENGINQLQEYEVYYVPFGERDRQITDFQLALANPDPSRVNPSTVTIEQINKRIEREVRKLQQ